MITARAAAAIALSTLLLSAVSATQAAPHGEAPGTATAAGALAMTLLPARADLDRPLQRDTLDAWAAALSPANHPAFDAWRPMRLAPIEVAGQPADGAPTAR